MSFRASLRLHRRYSNIYTVHIPIQTISNNQIDNNSPQGLSLERKSFAIKLINKRNIQDLSHKVNNPLSAAVLPDQGQTAVQYVIADNI